MTTPFHRACALLLLASAAWAGPSMTSASNSITRDVVNGGGTYSSSGSGAGNNIMTGSVGETVMITTSTSGSGAANSTLRAGWSEIAYYPGTPTALASSASVSAAGTTITWTTPGYDGTVGTALSGSAYLIQVASQSTLGNLASLSVIAVTVSTSGTPVGTVVGAAAGGLDPNTTFYAQVFLRDSDANVSVPFNTDFTTFTTLASPPVVGALEFLSIQQGSVTVAWLAPSQPSVSSQTNEGYILQGSSNNFGALAPAGAPVFSSTTFAVAATTLTLGVGGTPLDLSNTYYFQVGSLNWAGQPNYATFTRLNFELAQSTNFLHLGAINAFVAMSTVSTSSMVVTNVGNWPMTITLSASTATVGTPWTLAASSGIDAVALYGAWSAGAVGPSPSAFQTPLTPTSVTSQSYPGNYATSSQSGYEIPAGQSSSLWVMFWLPWTTSTLLPQTMTVTATPSYP